MRRILTAAILCAASLLVSQATQADRSGVYWPGGTKPTVNYTPPPPNPGLIEITWPAAMGNVFAYETCAAAMKVRNCTYREDPGYLSLIMLTQFGGTWTVTVTAYDYDGDSAVIKTRFTFPN